jgi:hypothetical protein
MMKLSSFVMFSSQDVKLSSWAVIELSLVVAVAAAKLTLVVAVTELSIVAVAAKLTLVVAVE